MVKKVVDWMQKGAPYSVGVHVDQESDRCVSQPSVFSCVIEVKGNASENVTCRRGKGTT